MQQFFVRALALLLLQLLLLPLPSLAQCPTPFNSEAGRCVFVETAQSHSWCSANERCAALGAELLNLYDSLKAIASMPSFGCGCDLWLGVTDVADEQGSTKAGWQLVNDNGLLPEDNALWPSGDPNDAGNQDCVARANFYPMLIVDKLCSDNLGFACEFVANKSANSSSSSNAATTWHQTPFKRASYNPSTEYCHTDLGEVDSAMKCVAAAGRTGSCRHALYNSKLRLCRLLLFTDAQVELEIETSADWVKFSVH